MTDQSWLYWPRPDAKPLELTRKGLMEMIARREADPAALVTPPFGIQQELRAAIGSQALLPNLREAEAAYRAHRLDEALRGFTYLQEFRQDIWEIHYHLGLIHYRLQNLEASRTALLECLRFQPPRNSAVVLNNLGAVHAAMRELDTAREYLEKAAECEDALAETCHNLSVWYARAAALGVPHPEGSPSLTGWAEKAHELFQRGRVNSDAILFYKELPEAIVSRIVITPEEKDAKHHVEEARRMVRLGDIGRAHEHLQTAEKIAPGVVDAGHREFEAEVRKELEEYVMAQISESINRGDYAVARQLATASLAPLNEDLAGKMIEKACMVEAERLRERATAIIADEGDSAEALSCLMKADVLDPEGSPDIARLREELERKEAQEQIAEVLRMAAEGRYDRALLRVDELRQKFAHIPELADIQSRIETEKAEDERIRREAKAYSESEVSRDERAAEELIKLAQAYEEQGKLEESFRSFASAAAVSRLVARRHATFGVDVGRRWEQELVTRVQTLVEQGKLSEARELVETKLVAAAPAAAKGWTAHIKSLQAALAFEEGQRTSLAGHADNARALFAKAVILDEGIRDQVNDALAEMAREAMAHDLQEIETALLAGEYRRARELADELAESHPDSRELIDLRRQIDGERLRHDRERVRLSEARRSADETTSLEETAARAEAASDFATALSTWSRLITLHPDQIELNDRLTECVQRAWRTAREAEAADKPEEALQVLQALQRQEGERAKAATAMTCIREKQAARDRRRRWEEVESRALALARGGKRAEALVEFGKAIRRLGPGGPSVRRRMQEIEKSMGWLERWRYRRLAREARRGASAPAAQEGRRS